MGGMNVLKTKYIRDGKNQIIGSITSGFDNGDDVARDRAGHILGHSNSTFHNTRDSDGRLVSQNVDDTGLLFVGDLNG
jgi:hypothetical protein